MFKMLSDPGYWSKTFKRMALITGIVFFAVGAGRIYLYRTEPYQVAIQRLSANPSALDTLGTPISTYIPWTQHLSFSQKHVVFAVEAEGPKGHGRMSVDAVQNADAWTFDKLELVAASDGHKIDLR